MPQLFMIAGPNGAGKTTSAMTLLPDALMCKEYVNADAIAAGLSPFQPEEMAFAAGRLMLERIHQLADQYADLAFETTGASKTFAPFLLDCKRKGYTLNLLYLWLETPELALARIAARVEKGGHDVPEVVVRRRYKKSIENLFALYMPIINNWFLYDNSTAYPSLIAKKTIKSDIIIANESVWKILNKN